jgi:hypothetical protein
MKNLNKKNRNKNLQPKVKQLLLMELFQLMDSLKHKELKILMKINKAKFSQIWEVD